MIEIENLTKNYESHKVLDNLDLELEKGEILEIRGSSGKGKTTLKRCIAGLEDYDEGQINVEGEISFVFQDERVLPWLNVMKNILAPLKLGDHKITDEKIAEIENIAERFGVDEHLEKDIHEVSGGELQRLITLRGIVTDPEVLILDEPFNSVDQKTRSKIYKELLKICREKSLSVLIASHEDDINGFTDRVIKLDELKRTAN
jgi:ABC-type nitrate/sulfonate/bicarbonate transport system ATPase subunit